MSETSTSTPAPAAPVNISPTPAHPQPPTPNVSPTPGLSVREAARLLSAQRRPPEARANGEATAAPVAGDAAQAPTQPIGAEAPPAAAEGRRDAFSDAMREIGGQRPDATPADDSGAPYALDGRNWTPAELRDAIERSADYTKKTQELARQQRELSSQLQQFQQFRQQHEAFQQALPLLQPEINKLVSTFQPAPRPDPGLIDSNPQEYHRQWAAFEHSRGEMERIQGLMAAQMQAQERNLSATVAKSNEVLSEKYAFWRDPAQRSEIQARIADWAVNKGGFTRDELRQLADHRHLEAMMKASMFDNMMAGAKTAAPMQIRPPIGGAPPPAPAPQAQRAAEARFDERPSWRNGAALLTARRMASGR